MSTFSPVLRAGTQTLLGVCLKQYPVFPSSPLALQASLQTSIFQERNRTIGAAMSLIKKSDVKNQLSPEFRTKIHLCEPVSRPDATGDTVAEADAIPANPSQFSEDIVAGHSSSGLAIVPTDEVTGSIPQAPATSESVQP